MGFLPLPGIPPELGGKQPLHRIVYLAESGRPVRIAGMDHAAGDGRAEVEATWLSRPEETVVRTGCDILAATGCSIIKGKKTALLCNQSSVDSNLRHAADVISEAGIDLRCLFGPQHGLRGDTQANMIEWEGYEDPNRHIPVYSLYGSTRTPSPEMLDGLDTVVIDLPDIGARPYTYIWTAMLMMQACAGSGIEVVVLDRPNPLGGAKVEGPVLAEGYESFVGLYPLPVRHGMTAGEILAMIAAQTGILPEPGIVLLEGWKREMLFEETRLHWILPSPNMPTPGTAIVYPGMVMLEATNISEGRGTTRPFELVGAPWIDPHLLADTLSSSGIDGALFRPATFSPVWDKYAGELCGGVEVVITDVSSFQPVRAGARLIASVATLYPDHFEWLQPPYEYEEKLMPIDILSGSSRLRETVDSSGDLEELLDSWKVEEERFDSERKSFLLY